MGDPRILIVDDSSSSRKLIHEIVGTITPEISEAGDGKEGFNQAQKTKFDLIITDIDMPRMNGVELCQQLKTFIHTRSIPVIMVSNFDTESDIDRGFEAGASAYISKKEVAATLLEKTRKILQKSTFLRERTVLVVDDSHAIRRLVREGLSKAGFKVITAKDGKEALFYATRNSVDLILSDINMPEMGGMEFCEKIHGIHDLSAIPFIVMSTINERSRMVRILELGADAYIVKPFNIDQLVILVEKFVSDQYLILLQEKKHLNMEQKLLLDSIASLVSALEARDAYTRGHSEAVAEIISHMAELAGAGSKEIETIRISGRLHDIGKIGVRDSVLLKPGALTNEEFDEVKRHPVIGANILHAIPSLNQVKKIVLYHHERFDGKGYPEGLKGDDIPKWARMTSVADTYHALISDRPYRNGLPQEKALQIITDGKGSQFCPEYVDLFLEWIKVKENKLLAV
ncbi:MAG: response regulator [Spirochaetota bacterium]